VQIALRRHANCNTLEDLGATNWTLVATNTLTQPRWFFIDTNTPFNPAAYFRVRLQP